MWRKDNGRENAYEWLGLKWDGDVIREDLRSWRARVSVEVPGDREATWQRTGFTSKASAQYACQKAASSLLALLGLDE